MRRRHAAGFTLLETIVTLVIVSLMVALLMQALSQVLNLRQRVLRLQSEARTAALQERWFRESLQGAIADLPDAFGEFQGSRQRLEFVSAVPLDSDGLGRVHWEIVRHAGGLALAHQGPAGERFLVAEGPFVSAEFDYRGMDGEWQPGWTPEGDHREVLPRLVRFRAEGGRGRLHWIVAVPADPAPANSLLRPEDQSSGL
jgi:prepilin-type N-terminal cleavage/methylation domain-containing protein